MTTMKTSKLPKWFDGELYTKGDTVKNPFSGEICELNAEELSMYDFIMGAQFVIDLSVDKDNYLDNKFSKLQDDMRKALDWFRTNNPKAYMILLD